MRSGRVISQAFGLFKQFHHNGVLVMGIVDDIGGWATRLKRVYDLAKDAKNIELTETISDLRIALSGWKVKFAEMEEESLDLQAKLKELQEKLAVGQELVFRDGAYYRAQPIEGGANGPFCPGCWETGKIAVSMAAMTGPFSVFGRYSCPKCRATV
jgi:hypothetical protein